MFTRSISRVFLGLLVASLLAGCQTTTPASHKNVSSEETDAFLKQFGANNEATQKGWREFVRMQTGNGEKNEGEVFRWAQPFNKNNPCKVHQLVRVNKGDTPFWENPDFRIYWDGDCRNGYAYGIGREFRVVKGEISSFLADYDGEQKEPTYHLMVFYDRQIIVFHGKSHPYYATLTYALQQNQAGKGTMNMKQQLVDLSEDRVYRKSVEVGGDKFQTAVVLPNKNKYVVDYNVNPAGSSVYHSLVNGKGEYIGYAIGSTDNGVAKQVRHLQVSNTNAVDVILPESYHNHLMEVNGKINSNLAIGEKLIQESYVVINKYKRRICKGDVRVDFVDNEIYGRICLENGEFEPYAALIADSQTQQEKRHVKAREDITHQKTVQQQQSRNDEIARRQANQAGAAALSASLNDFAQDMAALNRNSAQFTSSFMNPLPSPGVNFGQPEVRTNCVRVANIVSCRTQ